MRQQPTRSPSLLNIIPGDKRFMKKAPPQRGSQFFLSRDL